MNRRGFFTLIVAATALLASGCKTIQEIKGEDALKATLRSYEANMRWGHPEQAYGFLKPDVPDAEEIPEGLDNIRVTGYQVIRPPAHLSEHVVTQTAVIEYIFRDRQVSRSITDHQIWEFNADEQRWYRTNPVPAF